MYDIASKKIAALGIENHPALWIRLLHQRTNTALFHSKLAAVKKYLAESYSSITKYQPTLNQHGDSLKAQTQVLEANYFYVLNSYANALVNLNEAETYFKNQKKTQPGCATLFQILQFQASIYQLQGELESCIDRSLASIQYFDCSETTATYRNYILIYRNVGLAYSKMGNLPMARKYFFAGKANLDSIPETSRTFNIRNHALVLYNSIGEFYIIQKKIDSAKLFYNQALANLSANANYISRVNEGLGKIALAEKDYTTALDLFKKSVNQTIQSRGQKHYLTANLYRSISTLYEEKKDAKNSLLYLQKALASLSSGEKLDTLDFMQNPALNSLAIQKQTVITLHQKASTLTSLYQRSKSPDYLSGARNTILLAIQFIDSTRNEFNLDKDKVVLGEDAVKVYHTGIHLASLLYHQTNDSKYLSECFELIDKSKSAVLTDHIKLVKNFSGIPGSLLDRQRELKVELSVAEQQLYNAEIKKEETSSHRQHFGEIKKAYTTLLNDIRVAAPNYYKLRIENKNPDLAESQKMLGKDEALVEYFLGDTILYSIVISSDQAKLFTTPIDSVREQVESLRLLLTTPSKFSKPEFQKEWNQRTGYLSQKLIAPWTEILSSIKRVIIVPHDVLNYLPFEMLPAAENTPMINKVAISYASSANLLREQKNMNAEGNFFAGFNADYSNQTDLPRLAGALNEVSALKNIFGFRASQFSAATAEEFRKEAAHYKIIHLALHSLINDEKPMFSRLVFTQTPTETNADITANELYSMELNAEIAVLSACETGLGKLHRGEGMMSLSRAFMYAGVPSTVISLWKVPDQSASILMKKFYQFLKDGKAKDEALQLAKLDFIKENPEMSHPFFWAGFIVNGKTDPITVSYFSKRELLMMAATLIALLLIIGLTVIRKKRKATALSV